MKGLPDLLIVETGFVPWNQVNVRIEPVQLVLNWLVAQMQVLCWFVSIFGSSVDHNKLAQPLFKVFDSFVINVCGVWSLTQDLQL